MQKAIQYFESPVGLLEISADDVFITDIWFCDKRRQPENPSPLTIECCNQLENFFEGRRKDFSLKLNPSGTEFQLHVWNELQRIPFGKTISYIELARRLGDEKKVRAVGTANGRNPIPIIIPCHRVIGSNGSLVGYGGGLPKKKWLLEFESGSKQTQLTL